MFSEDLLSALPAKLAALPLLAYRYMPEIMLAIGLVLTLLIDLARQQRRYTFYIAWAISLASLTIALLYVLTPSSPKMEAVTTSAQMLILGIALLTLFTLPSATLFAQNKQGFRNEFFTFFLATCIGLLAMVRPDLNLLYLYIFAELSAISSYILVIFHFDKQATRSSMTYILYGSAASGITLYGMSWLYGLTGNLDISFILSHFQPSALAYIALILTLSGFLFKVSAFPWHIWTPDIYQFAPTPLVAFLSLAPKLAGLVVLYRLGALLDAQLIISLSLLTLFIGNISALQATDIKRLLAYSAIAQAGLLLVLMYAPQSPTNSSFIVYAVLYYWVTYAISLVGVIVWVEIMAKNLPQEQAYQIAAYGGWGKKAPLLSACLLILMLNLIGLPPVATFWGKLFIFSAIGQIYQQTQHIIWLLYLILALLNTALALFYYLKVPYKLFFKPLNTVTQAQNATIKVHIAEWILLLGLTSLSIFAFFTPEMIEMLLK